MLSTCQAFDIQILATDRSETRNQLERLSVMELVPETADSCVYFLKQHDGFAASVGRLLPSRYPPLRSAKSCLRFPVPTWVWYANVFGNVITDRRMRRRKFSATKPMPCL